MTEIIKSPLNYIGGKYKLLPQILPYFPKEDEVDVFIDLFTGGGNVFINTNYQNILANDKEEIVIKLYEYLYETPLEEVLNTIYSYINTYNLTKENKEGYEKLRRDYNQLPKEERPPIMLYVLTMYAFNYQIRHNRSGNFNTSFGEGKSSFNKNTEKNMIDFVTKLQKQNILFKKEDFRQISPSNEGSHFYYVDPPYFITTASYNENGGWDSRKEIQLLNYLTKLNKNNHKFILSNVVEHKGKTNKTLLNWAKNYDIILLDYDYNNSSHVAKNTDLPTKEVLIKNF